MKAHPNGTASPPSTAAPVIAANAVYSLPQLAELLSLRPNTLPREIRKGRLRASKRAGRCFVLGTWVLAWIEAGEVHRPQRRSGQVD